jgi:hypothetical protein
MRASRWTSAIRASTVNWVATFNLSRRLSFPQARNVASASSANGYGPARMRNSASIE